MTFKTTYVLFGILAVVLVIFIVVVFWEPSNKDANVFVLPSAHDKNNPLKTEQITHVEIERTDPAEKTVMVKEGDKSWRITEPREFDANANEVRNLIDQVLGAKREEDSKPGSLQELKLDPPRAVITLKKGDERAVSLNV